MTMEKDEGWAWIVSLGSFIAMFLEIGMVKSLGVLLPVLRDQFTTQTWAIGLTISLLPGFGAITCVAATGLRSLASSRFILISFSLLSSLGFLLISLSGSVHVLAVGVILAGFSCGAEATTFSILPIYFDKYYDISNSISNAGLSVGVMTMPLLTQLLLDTYGWRGAMLILAALNTNTVLIGVMIKNEYSCAEDPSKLNNLTKTLFHKKSHKYDSIPHSGLPTKKQPTIITVLNLDFYRNVRFIAMMCATFGNGFYFTGWLIYMVPHAENLGFSPYASSAIATIGGFGNLVGSLAFPILSKMISSKSMVYIFHLLASVSIASDTIASIGPFYIGLMVCSFMLNFANGIWGCAFVKECANIFDDERSNHGILNWAYFYYGVGSVGSGFLVGWFFDKFNNYTASYLCLCLVPALSLVPMLVQCIVQASNHDRSHRYSVSKDSKDYD